MKKEWFFDRFCGTQIVVYAEDGKVVEIGAEAESPAHAIGNIYKGKVMNVVAGMHAAFVNCGMEKNCYLPLSEAAAVISTYDGSGRAVRTLSLKEGDEILVQLVKPARGSKGAKVTCDLSFVGKNLIYLPHTDFLGISRKLTDESVRETLLQETQTLREEGEGFIVRTAAERASEHQLKVEAEYLKRMHRLVLERFVAAPVGTVVYREYELPVKVMRDSLGGVGKIYVGDKELYEKVLTLVRMRSDFSETDVVLHTGKRTMITEYGLAEQIYELANRHVSLANGGDLVIDRTEAMTVIDVNTGKFTGDTDLESTVYETNLLAAKEIARQVRMRNIGGIIAVDFIDMADEEHKKRVEEALAEALSEDRAKCRVFPMSELCVTLFTRKRSETDITSLMHKPCPHCTRQGFVFSDQFMAMKLRAAIADCFAQGHRAVVVELNRGLMEEILRCHYLTAEVEGAWKEKRVYMIPHRTYHEEQYTIRGDNDAVLILPDDAQLLY